MTRPEVPHRIAAIGTFDGVHLGHRAVVDYLVAEGRVRGLVPTVVTFSSHPLALVRPERVPKSLCHLSQRQQRLLHAGVRDVIVLPFDEPLRRMTAHDFIAMLHDRYGVDAIVLGFNNSFGSDRLRDFEDYVNVAHGIGVDMLQAPRYEYPGFGEVSSTAIRHLIASGDVTTASRLLGHPLSLSGKVVGGHRLGRTIGFPTANLDIDPACAIPAEGVYACRASISAPGSTKHYKAMVNIGYRPTIDASTQPPLTVEAHLIDFTGDLYGKEITLDFICRLRPEQKFDSLDSLIAQLHADREAAIHCIQSNS